MALKKEHWTWEQATLLTIEPHRTNGVLAFTEERIDRNDFGLSGRIERIYGFELKEYLQEAYHTRIRELLAIGEVVLVAR